MDERHIKKYYELKNMKARLLKKLMNNTGYAPNNNEDYIALGSPLCHNLFTVDKKTLKIKYALDTFNEGRKCLMGKDNEELLFIWDKFHELVESGQINEIIEGNDEIENPIPVWTFKKGNLIESHTDKYGWPNTTYDGNIMYENLYFKTPEEAIDKAIREHEAGVRIAKDILEEKLKEVEKFQNMLKNEEDYLESFKKMKASQTV